MGAWLSRLFRLHPGEAGLVLVMSFVSLGNSLARQVTGIVAVSGFLFEGGGVNQILLVMLVDYFVVLLLGGVQSLVVDRINRVRLIIGISLGFAAVFALVRVLFYLQVPGWLDYTLLYLLAEQQLVLFPLVFWVLANDLFEMAQAKRLFPLIAAWGFIGKIAGSGVAAVSRGVLPQWGGRPEDVLYLNVLLYLAASAAFALGLRKARVRQTVPQHESVRETLTEGWGFLKEVPSFRYLMLAIMMLAVCDTIIEFRFLVVTDAAFSDAASYQLFYSLYRLGVTIVSFLIQTFLTSRLVERMGLKNAFFLFPAVALLGAVGTLAIPGVVAAVVAMASVKLIRETVDDSSRKVFQGLVPEERRGRVSTFMDSYLPSLGTMLACAVTYAIVSLVTNKDLNFYIYLAVALAGGLGALWATLHMRQVYDTSLFNWRLKRRQRGASVLDKLNL
jgi:AAA family ATP:ADP antiporter